MHAVAFNHPPRTAWWKPTVGLLDPHIVLAAASAALMLIGGVVGLPLLIGAGAAGLCMVLRDFEKLIAAAHHTRLVSLASRLLKGCGPYTVDGERGFNAYSQSPGAELQQQRGPSPARPQPPTNSSPLTSSERRPIGRQPTDHPPGEAGSTSSFVESMLSSGRYALLLRRETVGHLTSDQHLQAVRRLDEDMALVPAGTVLVGMAAERATLDLSSQGLASEGVNSEAIVRVTACYLNRQAVTNADYQHFVNAGGYEQLEFWPEEALPALFDFVDTSGAPGPRYWTDGHYPAGEENMPVVGVSWYEAAAYARWVGKRLPGDAEWTKACAWPIESAPGRIAQRRYPWGETFDARRANLWCGGRGGLAEVGEYAEGITVGGVEQMVGNCWEWTRDTLDDATPSFVRFPTALRSIRGGAFNTYFENQATCHYQSGEHPLARRGNIGIRLALDMTGLASPEVAPSTGGDESYDEFL